MSAWGIESGFKPKCFEVSPGPDSSHASWFISSVRLCAVFKVRVRPTRTVHADVSSEVDVGAPGVTIQEE